MAPPGQGALPELLAVAQVMAEGLPGLPRGDWLELGPAYAAVALWRRRRLRPRAAFRTSRHPHQLAIGSVARSQAGGYNELMSRRSDHLATPFTAPERDLLRRELCRHFGEDPRVADGIFLRTWRSGERRGQPKIPPAVQTMLERGLLEVRTTNRGPRAFFTEAGLAALRQLVFDRRAMDPERFAHLRVELELEA